MGNIAGPAMSTCILNFIEESCSQSLTRKSTKKPAHWRWAVFQNKSIWEVFWPTGQRNIQSHTSWTKEASNPFSADISPLPSRPEASERHQIAGIERFFKEATLGVFRTLGCDMHKRPSIEGEQEHLNTLVKDCMPHSKSYTSFEAGSPNTSKA